LPPLRKPIPEPSRPPLDYARLSGLLAACYFEAIGATSQPRVQDILRQWLVRAAIDPDEEGAVDAMNEAIAMAVDVAMFQPSFSGSTVAERFARQQKPRDENETAALEGFKRARFRVLRIVGRESADRVRMEDAATGEGLVLFNEDIPDYAFGWRAAARLCAFPGEIAIALGPLKPLDEAAFEVAMGFVRSGKGLINPERCAAAVYRHIVRNGSPRIPRLNLFPEVGPEARSEPEAAELEGMDAVAKRLTDLPAGEEADPEDIAEVRGETSVQNIIAALLRTVIVRRAKAFRLADAFMRIATIQLDTLYLRGLAGVGGDRTPLDGVAAAIDRAIADGQASTDMRTLFEDLKARILAQRGVAAKTRTGEGELDRVLQRIRALREKTIDQGCSEQEALAAAAKVAELLDRYGLSLSEIEIKEQPCESVGIDTGRRRRGPFDECIPAIGDFCDCRVWGEDAPNRALRYIFFGLPADVAAAHYLYDLIEATFETETAGFKSGEIYAGMPSSERRTAANSFQTGLGVGLREKLALLKSQRTAATQASSGRDLVPLKASVIDEELEKLGLSFRRRSSARKKTVLTEAYEAGEEAGRRFEIRAGLPSAAPAER
jgi:uncharacterized protein DUF2786